MLLTDLAVLAAVMSVAAFGVFAAALIKAAFFPSQAAVTAATTKSLAVDTAGTADVLKAAADFLTALDQSTPAITSLAASLLFLLIACLCGNAFGTVPTDEPKPCVASQKDTAQCKPNPQNPRTASASGHKDTHGQRGDKSRDKEHGK